MKVYKLFAGSAIIITLFFWALPISFCLAQNYANFAPDQSNANTPQVQDHQQNAVIESADLSDDQVENILKEEGVPLNFHSSDANISTSRYTLGSDDVIDIAVLRHPEVSSQFTINGEGKIQYGFVGDISVEGKTKQEVDDIITKILSEFIINPEVTVTITGYNSKAVYVIGEVGGPGKIFMHGDTITVREALVEAGLPLLSANTVKGRVITPSEDGKPQHKKVNVHKLLYQGDLRENLVMQPGDVLYVPPTFLAKAMRIMQPVAAPISTGSGIGRRVSTGGF